MLPKREALIAAIFFCSAIVLTLALGEGVIRLVAAYHHIYNIEMVKYARLLKMPDPKGIVSHVHQPSKSAKLMGVEISLNSMGNRGPEPAANRSPDCKRILVMGSSVTMGWGVPYKEVFTSVAEDRLNKEKPFGPYSFEVINAGIGNYNTHFQYELFKRQYPVLKPDMVVLHYFISDVQPRTMGRNNLILKYSYLAAFFFDRWSHLTVLTKGKDLFSFYNDLYQDESGPWKDTQREIGEMRDIAKKDNVPFLIMVIPDIHDLSLNSPYEALYTKMEHAFQAMEIPTMNTFSPFQNKFGGDASQLWIQSDDPHPNAKGHQLMADLLVQFLTREDPLHFGVKPASK